MRFEGKTAISTGAASGMGLLFSEMFAREGGNVVMCDVNEPVLKEKAAAMKSVLSEKVRDSKLVVLDELKLDEIKTKKFTEVLKNLNLDKAYVVLDGDNDNVVLSARNVEGVKTVPYTTLSVYDILKYDAFVTTKAAIQAIEEVYA